MLSGGAIPGVSLRCMAHVDRMGPQYAAYWGLMAQGAMPLAGMSQLLVEVSPSNAVFPLTDVAMKASSVRSAGTLVERDYGLMELHAQTPDVVLGAAEAILGALGQGIEERMAPEVISSQLLPNIDASHSQLFNKVRRGAWTLPGDTLYVMEVTPAAWIYLVANELEKGVDIELVRCAGTGLYGRLIVAGTESAARQAEAVAQAVIAQLRATATPATRIGGA
jgi:hypothetical protein